MDDEAGLASGCSLREKKKKKRSYDNFMMDEGEQEEPDSDLEERSTKRPHKEPKGLLNKKRQHSGNGGAESSSVLPAYPVCVPRERWAIKGGQEGSPSPMLECWVYVDNQANMADCHIAGAITPPATPVTGRPHLFIPVPGSVTASAMSSLADVMVSSPTADTCCPISSMCSPTASAWDTLRSTTRSHGCSDRDPVTAAAHLHLLGESLSLIGHHLQETNKMVSLSGSLSLLLDSLLCAVAPLICLTTEVPELRSCTQHTLASTLENIAYMMPGM